MTTLTPDQVAQKWATRIGGATTEITNGVNAVTTAPSASAIKQQAKLINNWNNAITSGKWAKNLGAVTLQQWQNAMVTKGIQRISTGAQAAIPNQTAFYAKLLPFEQTLQTQIQAMPSMTLADGIARATAWMQGMSKFVK